MLKPEIARRLGAPLARCQRCTQWVVERVFVGELYGSYDDLQSRALRVCLPCKPVVKEANHRLTRASIAHRQGLRQAQDDLRAFDRPSSAAYREACQRMLKEW